MFIHKCIYVIQILVSLACLLISLQHIEVSKCPVDVDVVLLNSLYSFIFSFQMFGVFFAHF